MRPAVRAGTAGKVLGAAHGDEHVCGAIYVNSSRPAIFSLPSLAGFTERFDTLDFTDTKGLLDELT